MSERIEGAVRTLLTLAVLAYAYLVLSFPDGYQISRFSLQIRLFVLGAAVALVMRSWWSLVLLPTAMIVGIDAAGVRLGLIGSARELVAASFTVEVFTLPATVLGAFLATLVPKLLVRAVRALLGLRSGPGTVGAPDPAVPEQAPPIS